MPIVLTDTLPKDTGGAKFSPPLVNSATGTYRLWRARNISGDYAAGEVVLYDASGNPLLMGDVNNVASAAGYLDALGIGRYNATLPTLTDTRYNALQVGSRGGLHVNLVDKDGTAALFPSPAALADNAANPTAPAVGAFGMVWDGSTWDRAPGTAAEGLDVDVTRIAAGTNTIGNMGLIPRTSGGLSVSRTISAATTNATSVKASAGQLFGWSVNNTNAAVRYLKLYNKASAPTVGTDTPLLTISIPAGGKAEFQTPIGIAFGTGLAFALTTGVADSDTAAVSANEHVVHLFYA